MTNQLTSADAPEHTRDPGQRLELFLDPGTCELVTANDGSGVRAATGRVDGVTTTVFASDPAVQGGAMGEAGCTAVVMAYERALSLGSPIVGLWHSGGARLSEGIASLDGFGRVFAAMTRASGVVPQISVVLGAAAGGAAYGPALTDVVVQAPDSCVFVTGPDVVRSVTGEDVDAASLGGQDAHGRRSGVAHISPPTTHATYVAGRQLVSLLGRQGEVDLAGVADRDLAAFLPESPRRAYDVHPIVSGLSDEPPLELQPRWAPNIVTALGRTGGRTTGFLANNPLRLGGCLDSKSAEKAARFVRMCDAFGVPLVVVTDVPGYLPGVTQEWAGVVRRGAKLLHAFAEATVPRITLVTRKAYGGAYVAMNSRALGATRVLSWPGAEVAVMGPVAAVRILHRRQLAAVPVAERADLEAHLALEQQKTAGGVERARQLGLIDEVVQPAMTRSTIARALLAAPPRRGRHGNIPL